MELKARLKEMLGKIERGENLDRTELSKVLLNCYWMCDSLSAEQRKSEYLESVMRTQIKLFKGILGDKKESK